MPKILIVDDEPHLRLLLEQTLEEFEDLGVKFFSAGNGSEAIDIIKREMPELVFLDVTMPEITGYEVCGKSRKTLSGFGESKEKNDSGYEVCRMVKKELRLDNVYIVMLTAKGQETERQKGMDAGADAYMNKPFNPDAIVKVASDVLKLKL